MVKVLFNTLFVITFFIAVGGVLIGAAATTSDGFGSWFGLVYVGQSLVLLILLPFMKLVEGHLSRIASQKE